MRKANKNKVILIGGNLLGCLCLKELLRMRNIEITAVISNYDDNGSILDPRAWNASLARLTMSKRLPLLQPKSLNEKKFLRELYRLDRPDYIISAQYNNDSFGAELLNYPTYGCINIHYAMLPYGRGYFPISWALIDNKPIGVTIHWMDGGIYSGDIIARQEVSVDHFDTAISLYYKVTAAALKLFKHNFTMVLEQKSSRYPQVDEDNGYHSSKYPLNGNIDWSWEVDKIDRMVRALTLPPFPAARTYFEDNEIEILNPIEIIDHEKNGHRPGQIIDIQPEGLLVQANDGCVLISKIRLNESLVMSALKFSQYYKLTIGDCFRAANNGTS